MIEDDFKTVREGMDPGHPTVFADAVDRIEDAYKELLFELEGGRHEGDKGLRREYRFAVEVGGYQAETSRLAVARVAELREALRHIPQCGNCASGRYYKCEKYTKALGVQE